MRANWKYIITAFLGLLLVGFIALRITQRDSSNDPSRRPSPLVKVVKPSRENMKLKLTFNGDVLPIQQAYIFSKVNGTLERIYADMGEPVKQGKLLAIIDSTEYAQQVLQTSATYENAQTSFERMKKLFEQNLVAKQDYDNAVAAFTVAKANYETAKTKLGYCRITAPFSGIITRRFLDPGAVVTSTNATLFTLMDLDWVKIIISVPEKNVSSLGNVKSAEILVDALPGKVFSGKVSRLSQAIDLTTRTMPVEVDVENASHFLKPGMFATVNLLVDEHENAVVLPVQTLLSDEGGRFVFIVDSSEAKKVYVKAGWEINNRMEILDGLNGEEQVVESGQQQLRDGVQVKIVGHTQ